ncbi:MAG: hypothetical protein A2857_03730 [Candidatus Levybacteria bacterium RIFCSPHIGHO2_01_FULL_36_15]|nr:MAG: hypothetical protein A2857_03730 [Candidatus Levybacteria bacterium RIFCSPHIGHO2_01_FULL_36_15]
MKKIILRKIVNLLNSGIDSEEKTLYLFVEIHKIRKLDGEVKSYLDFFRDWLVHDEISYKSSTDFFLNRFDKYISGSDAKKIAHDFVLHESDFFKFINLKTELRSFLLANNLPSNLTNDNNYWLRFVRVLVEILKECPVKSSSGKIDMLSLTEDNSGNICFRFHLRGREEVVKIKLKIKGL